MSAKPLVPRHRASQDIDAAIDYYFGEAGEEVALGFIAALARAYRHIARQPASGSLRYAQALDLPGLRVWPLTRYPYLVFYREAEDHIDVWRLLHSHRDIPEWLGDGEGG